MVPRGQADAIFAALRDRGVPVAYLLFPGEQHGFRQAATVAAVAEAELAFYGRVLGFTPAGAPTIPPIANIENPGSRPPVIVEAVISRDAPCGSRRSCGV